MSVCASSGTHFYTRVDQKALEALDTCSQQRDKVIRISRYDPAPEADIGDKSSRKRSFAFDIQIMDGGGRRQRIERHVHQGRDAAARSSKGAGLEALPFGSTRFIQVNMRAATVSSSSVSHVLYEAGKHDELAADTPVDLLCTP
jgi:hypothetical protein